MVKRKYEGSFPTYPVKTPQVATKHVSHFNTAMKNMRRHLQSRGKTTLLSAFLAKPSTRKPACIIALSNETTIRIVKHLLPLELLHFSLACRQFRPLHAIIYRGTEYTPHQCILTSTSNISYWCNRANAVREIEKEEIRSLDSKLTKQKEDIVKIRQELKGAKDRDTEEWKQKQLLYISKCSEWKTTSKEMHELKARYLGM